MAEDVDAVMKTIPEAWRYRWCGGEKGWCACLGCVQIGNRVIMVETVIGKKFLADPEYIDESKIPEEIFNKFKVTEEEWLLWAAKINRAKKEEVDET